MKKIYLLFILLIVAISAKTPTPPSSHICQACHPKIYREYSQSIHANSSIFKDPIHKAIWNIHPAKKSGNYQCGVCHTPSDPNVANGKGLPVDNEIEENEPISCQTCHRIKSIEKHALHNINIYSDKFKTFYTAYPSRRGTVLTYKEHTGLMGGISGSPFHNIDYKNNLYYTGEVCMGCHSHARNKKGFIICNLEVKKSKNDKTCIECHMPKVKGPLANQRPNTNHASHDINLHNPINTQKIGKYIILDYTKDKNGFDVTLQNTTPHTLFAQPLRLGELRVSIQRDSKNIPLKSYKFFRAIGKDGHPTPPWLATTVLKDTTIKAHETRKFHYNQELKKGDILTITLGYHLINPKMVKKIPNMPKSAGDFLPFNKKTVIIEK